MTSRATTTIFASLVFLCGLVTGLMADHLWEGHVVRSRGLSSESRPRLVEMVSSELSLTSEQSKQVEAILDDASKQFNSLHSQAHVVRQQSMERIRALLNDAQKPKFEAAMAKFKKTLEAKE